MTSDQPLVSVLLTVTPLKRLRLCLVIYVCDA
jgi:hypothetical protein